MINPITELEEEVIFTGFDSGWDRALPITLIIYKNGSMDIHRQTGSNFHEHMAEAEKILAQRGLKIDKTESGGIGMSGFYQRVIKNETS